MGIKKHSPHKNKKMDKDIDIYDQVVDAVRDINEDICELIMNDDFPPMLLVSSDGMAIIVEFMGEKIWCNDSEEREWIEDKNDYEPMKPYLKKLMKRQINLTNKIIDIL